MAEVVLVCAESSLTVDSNGVAACVDWLQVPYSSLLNDPILQLSLSDIALLSGATITLLTLAFCFKVLFNFLGVTPGRSG